MAAALKGKDCKECRGRTGAALDAVYYNHAKLASSK